jgi:ribosome biogenesis GTPase / thiamine phosphate phosphatase
MEQGMVMRSTGSWYDVLSKDKTVYQCRLRGKFKIKELKVTNPIAVGDQVQFDIEDKDASRGVITAILPRENYIIRKSVHKAAFGHIIAANLDQAILLVTLAFPRTSLGFIDRFLVTAESFRIPVVLVFNKTDLLDEDSLGYQRMLAGLYESIGYTCLFTSVLKGEGIEVFKDQLYHKKSLLAGHSGVGKSSLVNSLAPGLQLRTSEVSSFANKGVHTTTFAEMFEIAEDTFIIDTPGIKELGLMDMEKEELSHYFPEMREKLGECRFYNCTHVHEPGCAVMEALAAGEIAESRYASYLSMLDDYDNRR